MGFSRILIITLLGGALFFACHPEPSFIEESDAALAFNLDTVFFDTVFTTVGTVTEAFRVYNPHNQFLKIDEIALAGGASSVYRINVDGTPGIHFTEVEIAPRDSLYVFVEATLDPNESDDILRIQDSIVFSTNGNIQDVDLVAWGQDVHMISRDTIDVPTTWIADKPYLIVGYAYVDSVSSLSIDPGVKVFLHRDALIYVEGSLQVNGTLEDMSFTDMIQIICAGGKSMEITLTRDELEAKVWIQAGNITHACLQELEGPAAFYALMQWREGKFTTSQCSEFPPQTIDVSAMALLMEGARLALREL